MHGNAHMAVHKGIQNTAVINQKHGTSYMWLYSRFCNYIKLGPAPTKINSNTSRNSTQQTGKHENLLTSLIMRTTYISDLHMTYFQVQLILTLSADMQTLNIS